MAKGARAVVYIGDGQSNANLTDVDVPKLMDGLAGRHISVHSFAVGPSNNVVVLAAIANQTGGVVAVDNDQAAGREVGANLSKALHQSVIWPTERNCPNRSQLIPSKHLRCEAIATPFWSAREARSVVTVEIKGQAGDKPVDLQWSVPTTKADDDNAYLAQIVDSAVADGGYTLPTLGSEGLNEARRVLNLGANTLVQLGRQTTARATPSTPGSSPKKRSAAIRIIRTLWF